MNNFTDHYAVLEIAILATDDEIKRAYREKIKLAHPDKHGGARNAEDIAKTLNEARQVLLDPIARHDYDTRWRQHHAKPSPKTAEQTHASHSHSPPHPNPPRASPPHPNPPPSPPHPNPPRPSPPHPNPPRGSAGLGGMVFGIAAALLVVGGVMAANTNTYDPRSGRFRAGDGRFRGSRFF